MIAVVRLAAAALVALVCLQTASARNVLSGKDLSSPHIINGQEVEPYSHPHQVILEMSSYGGLRQCGGSLISDSWVITAAHCAHGMRSIRVGVGSHDRRRTTMIKVEKMVVHPGYDGDNVPRNDIALLKLQHSVNLDGRTMKAIRLPRKSQKDETFYKYAATATGWGRTKTNDPDSKPDILRSVYSTVISNFFCKLTYFFMAVSDTNICISGWGFKGACSGDSGGPLTIQEDGQPTLVGIASYVIGIGCQYGWPSVYERVTSHLDWIYGTTGITPRM